MIPADWEAVTLGSIGKFKNGINKPKQAFGSGHPFVNLMDVFGVSNIEATDHLGLIESNDMDRSMYDLKMGDVLFIRSSVKPSGVGLTTVIAQDLPRTVYSGFLLRFRDQRQLTTGFKEHCFHDERFRARIIANSTVSANTNINQSALKALVIGYPPTTTEQSAIAEALSDVDRGIAAVEAVIAKKRALKTATMQALLSGTRRLPGFSGEWERFSFGQRFQFLRNGSSARAALSATGAIGYIHYGDIHSAPRPYMDCGNGALPRISRDLVIGLPRIQNGDLLIADASEDYEGTGKSVEATSISDDEVVAGLHTLLLRPMEKMAPGFVGYLRFIPEVKSQFVSAAQGVSVYGLSRSAVKSVEFSIPKYEEQEAIASILSDMEIDLSDHKSKLTKLRHLKTGMMQQLLTGKIRLI